MVESGQIPNQEGKVMTNNKSRTYTEGIEAAQSFTEDFPNRK